MNSSLKQIRAVINHLYKVKERREKGLPPDKCDGVLEELRCRKGCDGVPVLAFRVQNNLEGRHLVQKHILRS